MANIWLSADECEYDEDLPEVCMVCGEESSSTEKVKMSWYMPVLNLLILAGLLPWAIIVMVMTKKMTVNAPVCDKHRGHWFRSKLYSSLAALAGFVALIVFMIGGFAIAGNDRNLEWLGLAGLGAGSLIFLVLIIIAVVISKKLIRPLEITEDEIHLTGVSEVFVDELKAMRKKNRGRRHDEDDEEDDDDRPARRR